MLFFRKSSEKEIVRLERVISNYESDISKLKQQLKEYADKEKAMKNELKNLRKNLEDLKDELDRETLKRIDIENRTQTLREEMEFKDSLKEKVSFCGTYFLDSRNTFYFGNLHCPHSLTLH